MTSRPVVLLLTGTIDPGNMFSVKRGDPRRRLKDYQRALRKWSRVPGLDSIIFCENSGFDLSSLRTSGNGVSGGRSTRFVSFQGNDFSPCLGKGYGEVGIIKHAVSTTGVNRECLLLKVTGRYFVRNADAVLAQIHRQPECDVFCTLSPDRKWAHSQVFAATIPFFETYLFPLHSRINDSEGVFLEHVLGAAIRAGAAAGVRCAEWCRPVKLAGVSGTSNKRLGGIAAIRMWGLERTYRLRRALGLYRDRGKALEP